MTPENTTAQALAATFAEFLALPDGDGEINGIHWELADSGIVFPEDAEDLMYTLASDRTDENLLHSVGELADKLADASASLCRFIAAYVEQRGAIKLAVDAVEAFTSAPTEANRLALVQASEALDGYYFIPMPRALKGKLRPFVTSRMFKSRINFGSLHWIAKEYLEVSGEVQEAA